MGALGKIGQSPTIVDLASARQIHEIGIFEQHVEAIIVNGTIGKSGDTFHIVGIVELPL